MNKAEMCSGIEEMIAKRNEAIFNFGLAISFDSTHPNVPRVQQMIEALQISIENLNFVKESFVELNEEFIMPFADVRCYNKEKKTTDMFHKLAMRLLQDTMSGK